MDILETVEIKGEFIRGTRIIVNMPYNKPFIAQLGYPSNASGTWYWVERETPTSSHQAHTQVRIDWMWDSETNRPMNSEPLATPEFSEQHFQNTDEESALSKRLQDEDMALTGKQWASHDWSWYLRRAREILSENVEREQLSLF